MQLVNVVSPVHLAKLVNRVQWAHLAQEVNLVSPVLLVFKVLQVQLGHRVLRVLWDPGVSLVLRALRDCLVKIAQLIVACLANVSKGDI